MTSFSARVRTITQHHREPTQAGDRPSLWWRRAVLMLLLFTGWLVSAQVLAVNTACAPAATRGTAPADYQSYCWIDLSGYVDSTARTTAGQSFVVTLSNGAVMSFTLKSNGALNRVGVPSWTGAAFGNNATFAGIPGQPVLYTANDGSTVTVSLNGITVDTSGGPAPFAFVAADGESTNDNETLRFTTSGTPWTTLASIPYGTSTAYPVLSGVGSATVTESGVGGTVGSYAFASAGSPGTVTAVLSAGGLQGALFGVKFVGPDLGITKSHTGNFATGANGNYNIAVHNYSFYATSGTTTVSDTLPAGLTYVSASGSGWTCGATGQVVTCANPSTLASGGDLPPITLTVAVAGNAPASVSNTATVTTLGDYTKANNSSTDVATVIRSDLSTSSKTVLDTNGGDTNPGDTLRYTITLTNTTAGVANNVSVSDDMPAGVGSLNVISTPSGSTNGSTTNGGINSTGKVSVTGISVPANGGVTIVYEVIVAAGDGPGYTIDNTATISNPSGAGASLVAPTITVSQTLVAPPATGNKVLYVQDTGTLTRTPQTSNSSSGTRVSIDGGGDTSTWNLAPTIATGKTLVIPAQTVTVKLVIVATGDYTYYNRSVNVALLNGNTVIGSDSENVANGNNLYTFQIPVSAQTIASSDGLNLKVTNNGYRGGLGNLSIAVSQKISGQGASTIAVYTTTVINVDSVSVYSAAYNSVATKTSYAPGDHVYVRAVISDPFGQYDVTAATLTLSDPDGTAKLTAAAMARVDTATSGATRVFEYDYTVPAGAKVGAWRVAVTGYEGSEGTITHTRSGLFEVAVPLPNLLVMKSVSVISDPVEGTTKPKSLPGAVMQYQITVSNNGSGPADNNSLVITDPIPKPGSSFVVGSVKFLDGSTSSGLTLAATDVTYSNNSGSTFVYSPQGNTGDADSAVTNLRIAPRGTMPGKTGTAAPLFNVTFQVIIP